MNLLMFLLAMGLSLLAGKLIQQLNLPALLGWLIAGMLLGPNVLNLLSDNVMDTNWFGILTSIGQMIVGVMIGSNLEWKKIKKVGGKILQLSLWHIVLIFAVVTTGFSVVALLNDIPLIVPAMFGLVAIASAPAPIFSTINEYDTEGPLTKTTVPLTVMNTALGATIFFSITSILESAFSGSDTSVILTLLLKLVLPIAIGFLIGSLLAKTTPHAMDSGLETAIFAVVLVILAFVFLFLDNSVYAEPATNFIMLGAGFASGFVNFTADEQQDDIGDYFQIILQLGLAVVIVSLSAPLNPSLLLTAGVWSVVYVALRFFGSWLGGFIGGKTIKADDTVSKYVGLTLTPHSGIALVHTGVAAETLNVIAPEYAMLLQTVIPAAAVINEIIAILISKKAYDWAGETSGYSEDDNDDYVGNSSSYHREPRVVRIYQNKRHPHQSAHYKKNPFEIGD
ncbi:MAG: cation:proton antiporter [Aerococcus sp.]|nr:cation:proton antiporter [Aerococcus sp.]